MPFPKVIIMRGVPGAGKSTHIKKNFPEALVVSADHFFMRKTETPVVNPHSGELVNEEYVFEMHNLARAHRVCFLKFLEALEKKTPLVVVDNTNIHLWEYADYTKAATMLGYVVEIVELQVNTIAHMKECINRNVHGVPAETIMRMCAGFEHDSNATDGG